MSNTHYTTLHYTRPATHHKSTAERTARALLTTHVHAYIHTYIRIHGIFERYVASHMYNRHTRLDKHLGGLHLD